MNINKLAKQLEQILPGWSFLLASGYEDHDESYGAPYFCHLMSPEFKKRNNGRGADAYGFGDTPLQAWQEALLQVARAFS